MAMAGWKTEDMLNGIEGIMNLAAASGEDLATTSDIVTDALTAMGLQASDSGHFADVLAAASSNSNTNVGMMGETFKYVAPVAGALGYNIEDLSQAIGLMANSGIKSTQAGTALRSILTRLAKPPKEAAAAMEKYDISMKNSDGSMKSLMEVMENMRDSLRGLPKDEKAAAAAALGGQEAMSGLLSIVNASNTAHYKCRVGGQDKNKIEFTPNYANLTTKSGNLISITKNAGLFEFNICGKKYQFRNDTLAAKKAKTVTIFMGNMKGATESFFSTEANKGRMLLTELSFRKDKVPYRYDIPNRYQPGCTIRVDGESSKVYVDNVISMDDEVLGSTYFLAPPGETTVQIHCSEFSTPEPTVKAYIREAFI